MKIIEKTPRVKIKDLKAKDIFKSYGSFYMLVQRKNGDRQVVCLDNGVLDSVNLEAEVEVLEGELYVRHKGSVSPGDQGQENF